MTIKEACNKKNTANQKLYSAVVAKEYIKTTYLPIMEKSNLIEETLRLDVINYDDAIVSYDSIEKTVFYIISVIKGYTNLTIEDPYTDFDALMQSGLMNNIFECIGEDVDIYNQLFEMRLSDILRENNGIESVVQKKMNDLFKPVESFFKSATESITKLDTETIKSVLQSAMTYYK